MLYIFLAVAFVICFLFLFILANVSALFLQIFSLIFIFKTLEEVKFLGPKKLFTVLKKKFEQNYR